MYEINQLLSYVQYCTLKWKPVDILKTALAMNHFISLSDTICENQLSPMTADLIFYHKHHEYTIKSIMFEQSVFVGCFLKAQWKVI